MTKFYFYRKFLLNNTIHIQKRSAKIEIIRKFKKNTAIDLEKQ
jgi:hypothetical protein